LFDGVAYGMLLFVLACGLGVTMGLMNFINLAHGAFAMAGGYITVILTARWGIPFLAALPIAFVATALLGAVLERTLYRRVYGQNELNQVLFSIGLTLMAVAAVDYFMGAQQQFLLLPEWLTGRSTIAGVGIGHYRLFIIVICVWLVIALQRILSRIGCGNRPRASVDHPRATSVLDINHVLHFVSTVAVGSGLAGLAGALGADLLGLYLIFPLKFMIYF